MTTQEEKSKTTNTKDSKNKKSIINLIQDSKYEKYIIMGALSDNQLMKIYQKELKENETGIESTPQLTTEEFTKMIETFLKKEV